MPLIHLVCHSPAIHHVRQSVLLGKRSPITQSPRGQGLLLDAKTEALDAMLKNLGFAKINPVELSQLRTQASEHRELTEQEVQAIREVAVAEFKRQFNLNATEPLDVTDLFYRERALQEDNKAYQQQIQKLETEIARMRTHIESESTRVAKAIEAARTNIQNNIESGVKR